MSTDPTPLGQDGATPAALRKALQDASSQGAPPDLVARLLQQAATPPAPPSPPRAAWKPWLKWITPIATIGLVSSGLLLRRALPSGNAASPTTPASPASPASPAGPTSASPEPLAEPTAAAPESAAPLAPPLASSAPASPPGAPSAGPLRGPDEAALLERARAALATHPARALALTQEHARRFPRGLLAQEREVLAVEALRRLGRQGDASSRGDSFRKENPDSAYVPRVTASSQLP